MSFLDNLGIGNFAQDLFRAGVSYLGGKKDREFARDQQTLEAQRQEQFARMGVRWRVEDAEAAGVHPLYALGGSGATYTPSPINANFGETFARMGQNFTRAAAAQMTQEQRDMAMEQLANLRAQRARTEAETIEIYDRMNRLAQPQVNAAPFGPDVVVGAYKGTGALESHPLFQDAVKLSPDEMVSRDRTHVGQTAGRGHPSMREFTMPNGDKVLLPATGQGGIPEEIDFTLVPEIIGANIRRYGGMQTVLGALFRWFGYSLPELQAKGEAIRREYQRTGRMPGDR